MAISELKKNWWLISKFEFLNTQVTGSDLDLWPTTFWPTAKLCSLLWRVKISFCFLSSTIRSQVIQNPKNPKINFKMPINAAKIKIFSKFQRSCESIGRVYVAHQNLVSICWPLPTLILAFWGDQEKSSFFKTSNWILKKWRQCHLQIFDML